MTTKQFDIRGGHVFVNPEAVSYLTEASSRDGARTEIWFIGGDHVVVDGTDAEVATKLMGADAPAAEITRRNSEARRLLVMQALAAVEEWLRKETPGDVPMSCFTEPYGPGGGNGLFDYVKRQLGVDEGGDGGEAAKGGESCS